MITPAHAFFNWAALRRWLPPWWVVAGSVLPDIPAFAAFFYLLIQHGFGSGGGSFFGFIMANGNPNRQPGFMQASFLLNALPLYALVGLFVLVWRRRWLVALWAGWGLHVLEDFLTHVTDAYAPLYPFLPEWTPRGVVSYWDPQYGAGSFGLLQLAAAALVLAWLVVQRRRKQRGISSADHGRGTQINQIGDEELSGRSSKGTGPR